MKTSKSHFKQLMIGLITSGMYENYDTEIMRKVIMINIMTIIGLIILIPLGSVDLIQGNYTIGFFVLIVAAVLIINQFYLRKSGNYMYTIYCGISFVAAYFFYALVTGGVNNTGYLWYFTFPLFALFLLGPIRGSIATLLLLFPSILFLSIDNISPFFATYTTDFEIRFVASFLIVFAYSYLFETLREKAQQNLALRNTELEETITELKETGDELRKARDELEVRVEERTAKVSETNEKLQAEILERKRTEEVLRESEEKYRTILESIEDGYYEVDIAGKFTFFNDSMCKLLGYSEDELIGMNNRQYSDKETAKKVYQFFNKVYTTGKPSKGFDWEIIRKDGTKRDVETSVSLIKDEEGQGIGFRGILRDISERKQAEEALRTSQQYARNVIDSSLDMIITVDTDRYIVEFNKAAEEIFGYRRDEVVGTLIDILYANPQEGLGVHKRTVKQGHSVQEILNRRKDGEVFPSFLSASLLRDAHGEVVGVMGVSRNITERKQAEKTLQSEKEKFQVLTEESPFGISLIGKDGRYKYINPKFIEIFGYTLEDVPTGREWFRKAYPNEEYRNQALSTWISDLKDASNGEYQPQTFTVTCKDGSKKTIHFRALAMETGDQFVTYEDITEKKLLEAQFQAAQRMEAIGTLAGGVAHDFNNILMGIQGRTSLMLMHTDSTHPHFEHLRGIEEYVKSAADLTKQLLGFARGGKYEVKPTDLNELIKTQNRMFGRTKKEITVRGKYEDNLWTVEVDQGQIDQVLLNFYVNAWQAMPGGGDLYIQTENVTLDEDYVKPFNVEPGRYVKISITDTGVGMDEETQKRIFDPFFTTKEMGRGTGLGLASVYGIIKNHGGFINVYSVKGEARPPRLSPAERDDGGQGTTFNIYLPASEKEVIEEKEVVGEVLKGKETVLLVDDEDMIIDVGVEILAELGYKVLLARSGKQAIEIYKKNKDKIDIVILDMIMPEMGGGETYDILKEINPNIKVLLSSGYSINGQATEILERGCNGFIQKPFSMRKLSQELRKIL